MKSLLFVCVLFMAAFVAFADVNVAGKWTGTFATNGGDGSPHDETAVLNLKQNGNDITGTAGPNDDQQFPVTAGKIDNGKIHLEIQTDGPTIKFDLVLEGEHLKGDAHAEKDGQSRTAKLDVTRAK